MDGDNRIGTFHLVGIHMLTIRQNDYLWHFSDDSVFPLPDNDLTIISDDTNWRMHHMGDIEPPPPREDDAAQNPTTEALQQ